MKSQVEPAGKASSQSPKGSGPIPFVFMVGCPRSGTTLLQRIVNAHSQLAIITPETHWIPRYFEERIGQTAEGEVMTELIARLSEDSRFAKMKLDRAELEDWVQSAAPLSYASFVTGVFERYGKRQGKSLVGDKTPGYVRNIGLLHSLWPEAKFVHLIRDGRDVCLSAINWRKAGKLDVRFSTWNDEPVTTAGFWWDWHVRLGREAGKRLGPALYYEMRYEALVARPEEECARLCAFLGLPFEETMLRFHEGRTRNDPSLDAKHAWLPITAGLRDWTTQMPAGDVERFEAAAGGLLEELGYRRAVPALPKERLEHAAAIRRAFSEDVRTRDGWMAMVGGGIWPPLQSENGPIGHTGGGTPMNVSEGQMQKDPTALAKALEVLRHHGFTAAEGNFATGRPDQASFALVTRTGMPVVAKISRGGERTFANMQKVWRSSFGEKRQPPGLPQPLDYFPEIGVLVMERIEGRPFAELPRLDGKVFDDSIRLLAALHTSDAVPESRRSSRGVVRSIQRKADDIARRAPQYAEAIRPVVEALEAARRKDSELVPSHGDFSPRNVLVGPDRLALIDWDCFQLADPCRDLAYMATWSWLDKLRRGRWPDRSALKWAVAVYRAVRPGADLEKSLNFHIAAGLIRRAHSLVRLWPKDAYLVPALATVALRELKDHD